MTKSHHKDCRWPWRWHRHWPWRWHRHWHWRWHPD